jgi:hypothetical protein
MGSLLGFQGASSNGFNCLCAHGSTPQQLKSHTIFATAHSLVPAFSHKVREFPANARLETSGGYALVWVPESAWQLVHEVTPGQIPRELRA